MIPRPALALGWLGLAPALLALAAGVAVPGLEAKALHLGALYAGLILSFLGGTWWSLGLRAGPARALPLLTLAVLPSLLAFALLSSPSAARVVALGVTILLSPLVDRHLARLGLAPAGWMALRVPLSIGLGGLTVALGLLVRG
ncbi:DUF3429 domain-containing protein [Thermaurantiacus sp.]